MTLGETQPALHEDNVETTVHITQQQIQKQTLVNKLIIFHLMLIDFTSVPHDTFASQDGWCGEMLDLKQSDVVISGAPVEGTLTPDTSLTHV